MDYCNLYLDASGDTGDTPPFGKSKHDWHVLAGLVFDPICDLEAKNEVEKILEKYIPKGVKNSFPDSNYELHYTDILYGNNIYASLSESERNDMTGEIFDLIIKLNPILLAIAIQKTQMKKVYSTDAENYKFLAIRSLINKFSMYLKRLKKIGSIIYDAEEYRKDTELRTRMQNFRRNGIMIKGWRYQPRDDKLENVLNTLNLCPSEMSAGLQLTDFCARAIWQHLQRNESQQFKQIDVLFEVDADNGKKYDLTIFPSVYKWVT